MRTRGLRERRRHLGFSLVELMVASTVGLLIVGGLVTVLVQAGRSNSELAKLNQQMENGRFALQLLREDLLHAGFWGELSPPGAPTAMPPMCSAFDSWTAIDGDNALRVPVLGADNAVPSGCTGVVSNRKARTDVLMVRHASTCVADADTDNNCENFGANKLYLQASQCSDDAAAVPRGYRMATDPDTQSQAPFTLRKRDSTGKGCTAPGYAPTYADRRKVVSHLYYIRDDDTLMRSALDYNSTSGKVEQQAAQVLVEGIQHLELEYGVDTDGDGSANNFVSDPADAAAWGNVVAVRLHLLARALEPTPGYTDTKTYQLGPTTLGPFNDGLGRHVYSSFVRLYNPAGRRDRP